MTIHTAPGAYAEIVGQWGDFLRQIAGALPAMRERMKDRAVLVHLDDDEASEVAEMLAAPAIRWA
jgi:hypothetical protein